MNITTLATVTELVGLVYQCVTGDHKICIHTALTAWHTSDPHLLSLAASSTAVFLTSLLTARDARYLEKKHKHTELLAATRRDGGVVATRAATQSLTDFNK